MAMALQWLWLWLWLNGLAMLHSMGYIAAECSMHSFGSLHSYTCDDIELELIFAVIMPEQWCSKCIILPSQLTWHFLTVTGDSIGTLANAKAAVSCRFLCACAMTDCYLNFPPCRRVGRERR